MKYLIFIFFLIISSHFAYSQPDPEDKQLYIGVENVEPEEQVDHNVEPIGTYWELNTTTQIWSISTDSRGEASTITTFGESNFTRPGLWPGWNFFWQGTVPPNEDWALGFYKVSYIPEIQDNNDSYFYIDCRVDKYGTKTSPYSNPDFFVYVNVLEDLHYYQDAGTVPWIPIGESDIVRIWDIFDVDPPSSNSLPGYWSRVLLLIEGGGDHPRIAWGPHPSFTTTHFYIYRAIAEIPVNPKEPLTFSHTGTTNATTYEFVDFQFEIGGSTPNYMAFYIVKAYNSSSETFSPATNGVNTTGEYVPYKISVNPPEGIQADEFDLMQNYPNPFNPTTVINFSVSKNSFATLKVYDILGNEVAVLLNSTIEAGDHSVEFNAADLPSGIYLYKLQAGEISLTRKMILLR